MSRDVSVSFTIRAKNRECFVRDFIRKYANLIDETEGFTAERIRTEGDVLACVLEGFDYEDPDYDSTTKSWTCGGGGIVNGYRAFDGFREFFEWCAPYVDPETASFNQTIECCGCVGWRVGYAVADGHVVECSRGLEQSWWETAFARPRVSAIISLLERRRPKAWAQDDRFVVYIGMYGKAGEWDDSGEWNPSSDSAPEGIDYELDDYHSPLKSEDEPLLAFFELSFKRDVSISVEVAGPAFDWGKYVVYDEGLTEADLAEAVRKFVEVDPKNKLKHIPTY